MGPRHCFNLREVKAVAARLPRGDPVRDALLMEPDEVPIDAALSGKLSTYILMLLRQGMAKG